MNFLFIENSCPLFGHQISGGGLRSTYLIKSLAQIGKVDVITFAYSDEKSNIDNCEVIFSKIIANDGYIGQRNRKNKFRSLLTPWIPETVQIVSLEKEQIIDKIANSAEYDFIVSRFFEDTIMCGLSKYANRLILDIDDDPKHKILLYAKRESSIFKRIFTILYAYANDISVKTLSRRCSLVFYSNKTQRTSRIAKYLPNIYCSDSIVPLCDYKQTKYNLLFVGNLVYYPNIIGIGHFINCIFPKIKQTIPEVQLNIIGNGIDEAHLVNWSKIPGINIKGYVDDIIQEYRNCRAVVVPIYHGAGTAIKVLEAMSYNRPCISSPYGVRGYDHIFVPGEDYLLGQDADSFAFNVIALLQSEELNHTISRNAFKKVKEHLSFEAFDKIVKDSLLEKKSTIDNIDRK